MEMLNAERWMQKAFEAFVVNWLMKLVGYWCFVGERDLKRFWNKAKGKKAECWKQKGKQVFWCKVLHVKGIWNVFWCLVLQPMNGASQQKIHQGIKSWWTKKLKGKWNVFTLACAFGRSLPTVGMARKRLYFPAFFLKRELKRFLVTSISIAIQLLLRRTLVHSYRYASKGKSNVFKNPINPFKSC